MQITLDTSELQSIVTRYTDIMQEPAEGLLEAAGTTIMPDAEMASQSVWNVRTGYYSSSWYDNIVDNYTIEIGNYAEYAAPLEYGWHEWHTGKFVGSPGVLVPVVMDDLDRFAQAFLEWLTNQAQ